MKKFKINSGLIIFIVVIFILFLPIIIDYYKNLQITVISEVELSEKINNSESFIVYVGDANKTATKELRKLRDKSITEYSYEYNVYSVKNSNKVKSLLGEDTKAAIVIEGDTQKVYSEYNYSEIAEDTDIYLIGNVTDENRSYKVAENFKAYKKLVKSDEITMAVFGYSGCYHCNVFKPIYNAVAEKYSVDIYYFDSSVYDKDEYTKIINMDLTVPAKCNSSAKDFKLSDGFGTPLTIFTQDGKVIDCISGRLSRKALINKLTSIGMISE